VHGRDDFGAIVVQPQGAAMSARDAYVDKMKLELAELDAKMGALEAMANDAKVQAREKYNKQMSTLRLQHTLALAKLDELNAAGDDAWEAMTAEVEKMRDAFVHSVNYFKSQL
jgi:hypothetical protein